MISCRVCLPAGPALKRRRSMVTNRKNERLIYLVFTMPATIAFFLVVIMPFAIGIGYSFVDWDGIALNPMTFVGLDNYKRIFTDERFIASAVHTLAFTLMAVVTINVIGLALALLVTAKLKGSNMARTMFFMPNLIGGLILGYIWKFILSDTFRSIGEITGWTGIFFNWLLDPHFALFSLVVVMTWQMAGYVMIIYITGLQSVPDDLIEAAKIDGAGAFTRFFRITFPLIMPAVTVCIFYTLSNCFKIYDINLALTGGGPANATELFAMNIYNEIFSYNRYGYGQAKAIIFFFLVAIVTLTQVALTKRKEVQL